MAEKIKDGGSAFPQISTSAETIGSGGDYQTYGNVESSGGMTLRDYFAAKAMQAHIQAAWVNPGPSQHSFKEWAKGLPPDSGDARFQDWIAEIAVSEAEAMLEMLAARGDA